MWKKVLLFWLGIVVTVGVQAEGRTIKAFNDNWQFKRGPFPEDPVKWQAVWEKGWKEVQLPHTWNARDMQEQHNNFYAGPAYYRKRLSVSPDWKGKNIFLRFEGIGQVAEIYVNGEYAGNHLGGYSACAFDLTALLKSGEENEILVRVDNSSRPDVIPVNHSLFGVYGGIYRPVWLVITEPVHIAVTDYASPGVYITQKNVSARQAEVGIKVKIENRLGTVCGMELENAVYDAEGKVCKLQREEIIVLPQGTQEFRQQFRIKRPHLWQGRPDPYLYKVVTRLKRDGQIWDEVIQPLGFRKYEIIAGKGFYLNGEKYPMYGVTRHQDWWGLGSALGREQHDADLAAILDIGATTIRLAHYQQSDYFYSRCDSLGLIVWAEIPFVNRVSTQEGPNAKEQLRELIRQSFNHPSIYVWGLHNEVYAPTAYTAALTRQLHDVAKTEDPDRYTVSVNGYGHMEHPVNRNADIQGMNRYFGWYEKNIQAIQPWIEDLETRFPDYKLMLTEYGADANIAHQTEYIEESLDWTKAFYPETFQTKTHEYQWGIIAQHPYIIASYLWNMFDFAVPMWKRGGVEARNMKGLITFDRQVKKDAYYWYKANWSKEPVVYITQRRLREREKQQTEVTVYSNVGRPDLYVNGIRQSPARQGYTDVHFVFENVRLNKGKNVLEAIVQQGDKTHTDQIEWNYTRERKAGEAVPLDKNTEHWGF